MVLFGSHTDGKVTARRDAQNGIYAVDIEFQAGAAGPMRVERRLETQRRSPGLRVGDGVRVAYDGKDPARIEILSIWAPWALGLLFAVIGAGLLFLSYRL